MSTKDRKGNLEIQDNGNIGSTLKYAYDNKLPFYAQVYNAASGSNQFHVCD